MIDHGNRPHQRHHLARNIGIHAARQHGRCACVIPLERTGSRRGDDRQNRQFHIQSARVDGKARNDVTWENGDDIPHSVVEAGGKFHSKALDTGEKFTMTLADAGEVSYFCGLHPHMTGKIIVKP